FGRRDGLVNFDYADAASNMTPWRADSGAIWKQNHQGPIWEVPIYSENRSLPAFLTLNRIYRLLASQAHRVPSNLGRGNWPGNGCATNLSELKSRRANRRSGRNENSLSSSGGEGRGEEAIFSQSGLGNGIRSGLRKLTTKHAWKADFNQCTGRQLIGALERGAKNSNGNRRDLPFVVIGHSKLFTLWNERTVR